MVVVDTTTIFLSPSMAVCDGDDKFTNMSDSETALAFCYLEHINDEQNKISITEKSLTINYRNKKEHFELTRVKDLTFGDRKAMLYLLSGGIAVPFTSVAYYRDFLNPWPTLFLLFAGVFAIYIGWRGYKVFTIHLFELQRDYRLAEISENMRAFVEFSLKFLPINLPLPPESQPLVYHITDISTWREKKSDTKYFGMQTDGFIHASTYAQLERTRQKYFKGKKGLLLLTIDPLKVHAEIRYEDLNGAGQLFPHIYGDLNLDAIVRIEELS